MVCLCLCVVCLCVVSVCGPCVCLHVWSVCVWSVCVVCVWSVCVCVCLHVWSVCVWSVSKESQEALNTWTHHDNQQDSFCETEGRSEHCIVTISVAIILITSWVVGTWHRADA